jgi:hypothetical protein
VLRCRCRSLVAAVALDDGLGTGLRIATDVVCCFVAHDTWYSVLLCVLLVRSDITFKFKVVGEFICVLHLSEMKIDSYVKGILPAGPNSPGCFYSF